MKRIAKLTCLLLAVLLFATVVIGCGKEKSSGSSSRSSSGSSYSTSSGTSSGSSSSAYKKWMDMLKEYDAWADKYVRVLNKYSKNPGDPSALSEYTSCLSEMTRWEAKLADLEDDDDLTDAELTKVLAEYERITLKLSQATANIGW